ncbi:MAG: hypothetical protein V9H69_08430 [Anaerolineae bacterium]
MSFLQSLRVSLSGRPSADHSQSLYPVVVRCRRCGELLTIHVNLSNDLSQDYERDIFFVRKLISGSGANRCFQQIEVQLTFDAQKRLLDRAISGGSFADEDENDG